MTTDQKNGIDVVMSWRPADKRAAELEELAEVLGDPLPHNWQDARAVEARQDHLAALAGEAADAAVELLAHAGERLPPDHPVLDEWVRALLALDREWRRYVHDTQRGDAGVVVYEAAEFAAGALVATFVEGALEQLWRMRRDEIGGPTSTASQIA